MTERTFTPSPQQQAYFDWIRDGEGSCILKAVAGAGKTTTLIEGLALMEGTKFFGAYNKQISVEIDLKVRAKRLNNITVSTMHGAGFKYLRRAFPKIVLHEDKCRDIFREEFGTGEGNSRRHPLEGLSLRLVGMLKQAGHGTLCAADEDGAKALMEHFGIDAFNERTRRDETERVVAMALKVLRLSNENTDFCDFDDMIYMPLYHEVKLFPHDWVLIDEAQDTNATRRALALNLMAPNGRLVAVGDPHQAIYGFTGADNDALDMIAKHTEARDMPLTVSYRCPQAVVRHAQQWVDHIQAADSAPEGTVKELTLAEAQAEIKPGDAVLCRFNAPLVTRAYEYIKRGVPARIEGRAIGSGLKTLVSRFTVADYDKLLEKLDLYQEEEVAKLMAKEKEALAQVLADKCGCLRVIIERTMMQDTVGTRPVQRVCEEIDTLFFDNAGASKDAVLLSSIHKSKGREWPRVFWLQTGASKWARKDWEQAQELNLMYVATTRSQDQLYLVEQQ